MSRTASVTLTVLAVGLIAVVAACSSADQPARDVAPAASAVVEGAGAHGAPDTGGGESNVVEDLTACDPAKLGFPLPEGVRDCRSFDILTTFRTDLTPIEVELFYAKALAPSVWTRTDEGTMGGAGVWVNGRQHFELVSGEGPEGTNVQIKSYEK